MVVVEERGVVAVVVVVVVVVVAAAAAAAAAAAQYGFRLLSNVPLMVQSPLSQQTLDSCCGCSCYSCCRGSRSSGKGNKGMIHSRRPWRHCDILHLAYKQWLSLWRMSLAMNRPLPEAATPPSIPNALAGYWDKVYHEFENNILSGFLA